MAENDKTGTETQQQSGAGELKTDGENQQAADKTGQQGQGDGQQQSGAVDKAADKSGADTKGTDKAADTKTADAKTGDDGKLKAPEKYDLKLSDGSLLDSRTVDRISAIAREKGLSNEDAQAALAEIETQAMQERNERVAEWNESVKADKELGGKNFEQTSQSIQRYAQHLQKTQPELIALLERTGYSSHPAVVRYMRDQGNRMKPDTFKPGGSGQGKQEKAPLEERLYGKTTPAPTAS